MNIEEVTERFEKWYAETYVVRCGARGRASRNLTKHDGQYVSDHASECYSVWCAALGVKLK